MVYYCGCLDHCRAWSGRRWTARRKDNHESLASDHAGNMDGTGRRDAVPADICPRPDGIRARARYHARGRTAHDGRAGRFVVAGSADDRRKGGFALDIAGQLDSKVSASFENVPIKRALRRIVGRSSYIIELAPPTGAGVPRRIAKLSIYARSAPARVETSSPTRTKRGKRNANKNRRGTGKKPAPRRRPRAPSS